ncbi:Atxe2 family lasso peptide isopeptidase [Xanthomonas hortorum]|uniref:Peptidase S9 prolyl oligopeptidase catalytic domain-containing protein n=1 Tax=Xanthomonas hortorum pv. gardneri TaxID=2754056 RepID=A0A6V7BV71_9XANT|nr:Atxe2 family lasso peptide isopeptidase [Xanthomonas hortorum]MCC8499559.1 Atxe2 family lasso peptide isopeptidase [Xanthomonas hortorum pv. gardneri]MCC8509209.1 Atxe2 family lasso peptide isopeptidase [Xanthomonas hortorum pv. gardneri]MCC8512249.1 Atxe2 family lasso peptide isopeptidase [Xanthomonas hortorum pv. gardneri]MCC8519117.1 Atxe2 family lasso peptide isopeptidase [Xanthomonas hortorum pv. gardneri]MCC8523341.1 Atxe2 family lasso peptide isopeptidase [Xanthomonas hortorum pv. ga
MTNHKLWRLLLAGVLMAAGVCVGHAQTVSPQRLLEVVDIASPTLSPDGRSVAFRTEQASVQRNTYDSVWYVQGLQDAAPRRVADGGVPLRDSAGGALPAKVVWSPDGRWLYYRALLDGVIAVWRAAADGSGAQAVTYDAADVRDFALDADGRVLRYRVGATRAQVVAAEQDEYAQGIRIDETVPLGQGLFRSGNVEGRLATQRFGTVWFDRTGLSADVPEHWLALDLATASTRPLAAAQVPAEEPPVSALRGIDGDAWQSARAPQGDAVAVLSRVGDGNGRLYRPQVALSVLPGPRARKALRCTAAACVGKAITAVQWRPGSAEVLFTITDPALGLAQSIQRWNPATGQVHAVVQGRGLINGGRDSSTHCGASAAALVCVTAEADRPPRLERIAFEDGARQVLFDPNAELAADMARATPARLLQWRDARGRQYSGQFFAARGDGAGKLPLFVTYYSCPGFVRGGVGDEWPLAALAQVGISALCINQLPGYTMDALERHGEGLAAVESAVALLSVQAGIDRTRVGMGGLSFGGAVTLWTATESNLLAAASVANPVVSPTYYLLGSMKGEPFLKGLRQMWGLGAPEQTPERWKALSPAFKLDRIRAPILFQHSEQEYLYALDYVIPLLRAQRAELYVFPNEPHQKFQPQHKLSVYARNVDWFRFWLQDYRDAAPEKAAQYARWRAIKAAVPARGD